MTHDELIEAAEAAIRQALSDHAPWKAEPADFIEEAKARAAIRVIAPAVLEEVLNRLWWVCDNDADPILAIRALKQGYE